MYARQNEAPRDFPSVTAVRKSSDIVLDGRLLEEAWSAAIPFGGFHQRDPDEGEMVSEKTQVRFLYDDSALYVGAELFDRDPGGVVARTSRRDDHQDGDYFQLYLDPYHDRRTGVLFQVSAAGSLRDFIISNDTNTDVSWDAVWDASISRNELGWFVEMRIPYSQLRFSRADKQIWGVNAARFIFRRNETAWLELVPKKDTYGLASRFVDLVGLEGIEPGRNLEILPYIRGGANFSPAAEGNPFNDGSRLLGGMGLDLKYGLASNLTLDATVNPDFGQVEVDPAVVNLSAFETFFQERRPFFVEGSQIFSNFGRLGGGCCGVVSPTYFYSRRIGRSPEGTASGDFVDRPDASTIIGAAKLTGKPGAGWTIGLVEAVTSAEYARVRTGADQTTVQVEPFANYTVARVLREFANRGGIGLLTTHVQRRLDTPALQNLMPRRAHVIGADGYYYFDKNRVWTINGSFTGSWVSGSAPAIDRLQRSSRRYYQRPDTTHLRYDPNATSMSGWGGGVNLTKGSGGWSLFTSLSGHSPGFELNDAGFQGASDVWGTILSVNWRQLKPDRFTRNRSLNFFSFNMWNFKRELKGRSFGLNGNLNFLNYWNIFSNVNIGQRAVDDRLTRGGPMALTPSSRNVFVGLHSDGRKRINVGVFSSNSSDEKGSWRISSDLNLGIKPSSSMNVSVGPSFSRSHSFAQYVRTVDDPFATSMFNRRYIFADLDQTSTGLTARLNWSLTPRISVQTFSQILLSVGDYWDFKELERPRTLSFLRYGGEVGTITRDSRQYAVDPDSSGPAPGFNIADPNFNFKSLRMNAVFRWEWKPGSALFFVWQHGRVDNRFPGMQSPGRDLRALFEAPSTNVFIVKTSYWFNR